MHNPISLLHYDNVTKKFQLNTIKNINVHYLITFQTLRVIVHKSTMFILYIPSSVK